MFKDDYKSMMDDVPVNEALRAELLEKAQIAEESKSNVVKIPFIRRHTRSIASIAACVVIAAAAVGVVPTLMVEETPATTEVYEVPTSTDTPVPIQTDAEYEEALTEAATEVPESEENTALADTTDEPSAVYTPAAGFAANTGIVQNGAALQTAAPAAAEESRTQTSGSSSVSTDSGETAHTQTVVTTEETETESASAARAAENTDAAAGISTTALEEEEATAAAPTPAVQNGISSYSESSSSAASSSSTTSGSSSSSSSASVSVSSSSSSASGSSSSSSARSYSRSVIDYNSAVAYVEGASHVFIVNGVKVGAYESGGTWKAYYTADNVGYVVTFTGYDSVSEIKEAIKVYI